MSENEAIKTCGECLHCAVDGDDILCVDMPWHYPFGGSDTTTLDKDACEYFIEREKPTNGDKIREMSDEELATAWSNNAFVLLWCADCPRYCREYESEKTKQKCKQQMLNWLKQEAKDE